MSRKYFNAIAAKIKSQVEAIKAADEDSGPDNSSSLEVVQDTVNDLCDVFADANPNFDRACFLTACGM